MIPAGAARARRQPAMMSLVVFYMRSDRARRIRSLYVQFSEAGPEEIMQFVLGEKESVVIDNSITITVEQIDGDEVCLRIDHPDGVSIDKEEERAAAM